MTGARHHPGGGRGPRAAALRSWTVEDEAAVIAMMGRGMVPSAIAAELGIDRERVAAKVHQLRASQVDVRPGMAEHRKCLRCKGTFLSQWIGNRICYPCRQVNADEPPMAAGVSL